jgi:hypothetical protein
MSLSTQARKFHNDPNVQRSAKQSIQNIILMPLGSDQQQQANNYPTMTTIMVADRRSGSVPAKKRKFFEVDADVKGAVASLPKFFSKKETDPRSRGARQHRLAQNRKAARESRKRKKALVEELQRSLVFFSKANAALRNEYEDLTRRILTAHAELSKLGLPIPGLVPSTETLSTGSVCATAVTPPATATATAKEGSVVSLPLMEPGATMQGELYPQEPLWSLLHRAMTK